MSTVTPRDERGGPVRCPHCGRPLASDAQRTQAKRILDRAARRLLAEQIKSQRKRG